MIRARKRGPSAVLDPRALSRECTQLNERNTILLRENAELEQLVTSAEGNNQRASLAASKQLQSHTAEIARFHEEVERGDALRTALQELMAELGGEDERGTNTTDNSTGAEKRVGMSLQCVTDALCARIRVRVLNLGVGGAIKPSMTQEEDNGDAPVVAAGSGDELQALTAQADTLRARLQDLGDSDDLSDDYDSGSDEQPEISDDGQCEAHGEEHDEGQEPMPLTEDAVRAIEADVRTLECELRVLDNDVAKCNKDILRVPEMEREILEHRAHKAMQLKEREDAHDAERKDLFSRMQGLARVEAQLKALKPKLVQAKQRHESARKNAVRMRCEQVDRELKRVLLANERLEKRLSTAQAQSEAASAAAEPRRRANACAQKMLKDAALLRKDQLAARRAREAWQKPSNAAAHAQAEKNPYVKAAFELRVRNEERECAAFQGQLRRLLWSEYECGVHKRRQQRSAGSEMRRIAQARRELHEAAEAARRRGAARGLRTDDQWCEQGDHCDGSTTMSEQFGPGRATVANVAASASDTKEAGAPSIITLEALESMHVSEAESANGVEADQRQGDTESGVETAEGVTLHIPRAVEVDVMAPVKTANKRRDLAPWQKRQGHAKLRRGVPHASRKHQSKNDKRAAILAQLRPAPSASSCAPSAILGQGVHSQSVPALRELSKNRMQMLQQSNSSSSLHAPVRQ